MSGLPEQDDVLDPDLDASKNADESGGETAQQSPEPEQVPVEAEASGAEPESVESGSEPSSVESADDLIDDDDDFYEEDEDDDLDANPIEEVKDEVEDEEIEMRWYILKIQVNRETSICNALERRVKVSGLERYFDDILVPTEDVREFTKTGKQRTVKRKLYPGYIVVHMALNEETWFLVRETSGIGDFTGAAGKPVPLSQPEIEQIIRASKPEEIEDGDAPAVKIGIKFKVGDRVRVKEGPFEGLEGDIEKIDDMSGTITVLINVFGQTTPTDFKHWQVEDV